MTEQRIVCHFSAGAASAVTTKIVLSEYPRDRVVILNAFLSREHEDSQRFLRDCEAWFDHPITQLRDEKYGADPFEVWRRRRFIKNRNGAPCSKALKRDVLERAHLPGDIYALGYTSEEQDRYDLWLDANHPQRAIAPLIDRNLSKSDCLAMIERAGIRLPQMYLDGFNNNNCIGCCKGGEGYWNKIRVFYPEVFEEFAQIQDQLGPSSYIFRNRKTGERFSIRDLDPTAGRHDEPEISCSIFCEMAANDLEDGLK